MKKKLKKGFTLVELVIVIAVIAILSAVLIPTFGNVIQRANDSAAFSTASNALTKYTTSMAEAQQSTDLPSGYVLVYEKDQTFDGTYDILGSTTPEPKYVFRFENGALKEKNNSDSAYKFEDLYTVADGGTKTLKVVNLKEKYNNTNGKYVQNDSGTAALSVAASKATYFGAYVLDGTIAETSVSGRVLLVADVTTA